MIRFLLISLLILLHPVHVSILSLDYAKTENRFEVFMRIYYDDFLLDSGISTEESKRFVFTTDNTYTKGVLMKYINEKVRIKVNDKQVSLSLHSFDLSENELRMNLSAEASGDINSVTVKNYVMTTLYGDMANMIIVKVIDFEEGVKLTSTETEKKFIIN